MDIINSIAAITGSTIIAYYTFNHIKSNIKSLSSKKKDSEISFKQSLDLCNIPVITIENEIIGKINLMIDTGSSSSIIDKRVLEPYTNFPEAHGEVIGAGGTTCKFGSTNLNVKCQDVSLSILFEVVDMSNSFDLIKKEYGVTIHGILGSLDMAKYKYIIDFQSCSFYMN